MARRASEERAKQVAESQKAKEAAEAALAYAKQVAETASRLAEEAKASQAAEMQASSEAKARWIARAIEIEKAEAKVVQSAKARKIAEAIIRQAAAQKKAEQDAEFQAKRRNRVAEIQAATEEAIQAAQQVEAKAI